LLAREERETLTQQGNTLSTQIEAQNQVVRKLEEKERLLQSNLVAMDKAVDNISSQTPNSTSREGVVNYLIKKANHQTHECRFCGRSFNSCNHRNRH